jgi:hypothetical protein
MQHQKQKEITAMIEFEKWPKIERIEKAHMVITEKIDGTNAQLFISEDPGVPILAGSRTRWLSEGADNFGFNAWVQANSDGLRTLGPGRHYGEWYGLGIQRGYGLSEKRLSLFNPSRYSCITLPPSVHVVPVLHTGPLDLDKASKIAAILYFQGSSAVPGYKKPEGIVVQCGSMRWKVTDYSSPKSAQPATVAQ